MAAITTAAMMPPVKAPLGTPVMRAGAGVTIDIGADSGGEVVGEGLSE